MITIELRNDVAKVLPAPAWLEISLGGELSIWCKGADGTDEMIAVFAAGTWANAVKTEADA